MNYRKLLVLSIGSLSLLAPALADPQSGSAEQSIVQTNIADKTGGPSGKGATCAAHHGGMRGGLDLTDAQKEKLFTLKNSLKDSLGPKKLELSKDERNLKDLLTKPSIDRAAITAQQGKINELKSDIGNLLVAFKADFSETLTPEQRQKLRYAPSFGHHHRHGGPGRGPGREPGRTAEVAPNPAQAAAPAGQDG